jgi:hypothetical protein
LLRKSERSIIAQVVADVLQLRQRCSSMPQTFFAGPAVMSKTSVALLASAALTACAGGVTTAEGDRLGLRSDEFAAYAESVFRRQNVVLDALAFALDERPGDERLLLAEERVLEACAGLNEIAVRRRAGEAVRPLSGLRAARRVPACESAASQAAELLGLSE